MQTYYQFCWLTLFNLIELCRKTRREERKKDRFPKFPRFPLFHFLTGFASSSRERFVWRAENAFPEIAASPLAHQSTMAWFDKSELPFRALFRHPPGNPILKKPLPEARGRIGCATIAAPQNHRRTASAGPAAAHWEKDTAVGWRTFLRL